MQAGEKTPGQVEAFFTDEPSFMSCYINEGLNPPTVHDPYDDLMPLYPVLSWGCNVENQFTSRYGYDLREELAALFFGSGKHAERVRFDFWRLMSDLYEQSFFAQISAHLRDACCISPKMGNFVSLRACICYSSDNLSATT